MSVVVMAYRRRTFLRGAVQSVLDQTISPTEYEVIVIKDFVDPEIDPWLAGLAPTVRTVTEDLPLVGQMLARGLELARGEVTCFLDDDDRFSPEKLAGLEAIFRSDPTVGFVRNAYEAIDADGRRLPVWNRFRPQAPTSVTWGPGHSRVSYPWLYHFGAYVNVSSMTIRTRVGRRWISWLSRVPASQDVVLFVLALASDVGVRVGASPWTQYRVHASTSHPAIESVDGNPDARDFRRAFATTEILRAALASAPGHSDARAVSEMWRVETTAVLFLLDPSAAFSLADWLRLGRSALRRRQSYLVTMWLYCVYRRVDPRAASRAYQARRQRELKRTAAAAPSTARP